MAPIAASQEPLLAVGEGDRFRSFHPILVEAVVHAAEVGVGPVGVGNLVPIDQTTDGEVAMFAGGSGHWRRQRLSRLFGA